MVASTSEVGKSGNSNMSKDSYIGADVWTHMSMNHNICGLFFYT